MELRQFRSTRYSVSDEGKIYSQRRELREKIPSDNGLGYLKVHLFENGIGQNFYVHRLVAECFIPNPNPQLYTQVNHRDGNKYNNHVLNLEWCTGQQNMQHSYAMELHRYVPKPHYWKPVIQISQAFIVERIWENCQAACMVFGCPHFVIYDICRKWPMRKLFGGYYWCFKEYLMPNGEV